MKRLFKFTILTLAITQLGSSPLLIGQGTPAPAATSANIPRIQFAAPNFDFGKVLPTDKVQHDFIFTNIGNAMLEITDVHPGCGCTTAGTWDRQVQPGKTGKIPLSFNPASFSGTVSKGASVTCNDPAQGVHYLSFQATVWHPIDLQPQYAYFLPVEGEETNETKVVRIVNNQEEAITLKAPRSNNPAFQAELKTVQPGKEFELRVSYAGSASNTTQQGSITVNTSSTNVPSLSLTAMVFPQPAVIAVPQPIHLPAGPFSPQFRFPVTVRNNSHTPLKLSDPAVNAEGVTIQTQETDPGKSFRLDLQFPTNFHLAAGQALEFSVKTSHPKYPVLKLPITQAAAPVVPAVFIPTPVATGGK